MKTTQVQNLPSDFSASASRSAKSQAEAGMDFMSLLEGAMSQELPQGAEPLVGTTDKQPSPPADKASFKKEQAKESDTSSPEAAQAAQAVVTQPQPEAEQGPQGEQAEILQAIPVTAAAETITVAIPEAVQPIQVSEAGEAVQAAQPLPEQPVQAEETDDLAAFIGKIAIPETQPEQAGDNSPFKAVDYGRAGYISLGQQDLETAQQTFDQLVAKSAQALTAKSETAQQTGAQPQTVQVQATPQQAAAPAPAEQPQMEAPVQQPIQAELEQQPEVHQETVEKGFTAPEREQEEPSVAAGVISGEITRTETPATIQAAKPAEGGTPAQQVESQVIEHLEQEKMEFRMQLNPQQLGKIDVKMVLENGRLTVEIISASAKTAELLKEQASGLAASLRVSAAGLQSVQVVTQTQNENSQMEQSLDMSFGSYQGEYGESQPSQNGGTSGTSGAGAEADTAPADAGQAGAQAAAPDKLLDYAV